jgi:GNAT superfamily N-acetyltransferase
MRAHEFTKTGVKEGLEVDVPNENWLQDKIDYAQSKGRNRYGVPYMGTTTAYISQNQRVPVDILKRLPGMRGEQQNVRQQDLEAIIKIMKDTGKLPTMDNGKEYAPFINVAWNGEAWVNDGNHRIMAAAALGWKDLPVQISYFDGGERIKSGAMYPERIGLGGIAENFADGENPVKFTVSSPDGYQHSFQITLAVHGKHVGHFNFVRGADTDDVNNEAEVEQRWQGQGYGKLLLMKAIDVANNHGLDFQQDIRGITDAQQNVYDSLENAGLIVTPGDGFWFLTPQGEQELNGLNENFADGKNPGRKGLSKRVGVNTKASVSSLRKTAKNSSGEKQRMAHWLANMKAGRAKAKRK